MSHPPDNPGAGPGALEAGRSTWNLPDPAYDLVVAGAGHAGIEAALAGARLGLRTLLVSMSLQTIGQMSCNPAIGGVGKGQLVREIDALGGEMGRLADRAGLQFRMLNRSKGPAVWSPRAQSDKFRYAQLATQTLSDQPGLDLRQGLVTDLVLQQDRVVAVELAGGVRIRAGAVIVCAGTFLNGLLHVGASRSPGGRAGEPPALGLSEALARQGIEVRRYKTGTPPRVDRASIRFDAFDEQWGDAKPAPFRFYEDLISLPQQCCYATWTTPRTHEILSENLHRSPLFTGRIEGTGPRYCPSVEDKVVRFAEKDRHQLFLEPESLAGREMYVNGFSTSMPEDVQLAALRSVPGFEQARFTRPGYAIEYDYFPAWQMDVTLRMRGLANLFFAGQQNGTSGYEEASAQGLLAALNAAALLDHRDPVILGRDQAYIGVLLDDLVNKPLPEPYRMFTSRAEFRLLLRQDNADQRLMPLGHRLGLLEQWRWERFQVRQETRTRLLDWLAQTAINGRALLSQEPEPQVPQAHDNQRVEPNPAVDVPASTTQRATEWLKRPELTLHMLLQAAPEPWFTELDDDLITSVEVDIKYAGYVERQRRAVESFRRNEQVPLPEELDYKSLASLSTEARERLSLVRPRNLGQASRVGGVNPTDIQALWVHLQRRPQESPSSTTEDAVTPSD